MLHNFACLCIFILHIPLLLIVTVQPDKDDILHVPHTHNKQSNSESHREGKVGTLGKLFGKKKIKKGKDIPKEDKDMSPPTKPSINESVSTGSSASVDITDGSTVAYSPAEFLPVPRASVDSTTSSSSKSSHKKRRAPTPPTLQVIPQERLFKDIPESPMSEISFGSFSSLSSLGTPMQSKPGLSSSLSANREFDKRGSAVSLPDFYSHKKDPNARASSFDVSRLELPSPMSTSSLLAKRRIIYASIEDLSTVTEAVKELPLPAGAPPPKPKRFSASPDICKELLEEFEADSKHSLLTVNEQNDDIEQQTSTSELLNEVVLCETVDNQHASNSTVTIDITEETSEELKVDAQQSAQEKEEESTKLKQIYLYDMLAPHMQTTESESSSTVVDNKEVGRNIKTPCLPVIPVLDSTDVVSQREHLQTVSQDSPSREKPMNPNYTKLMLAPHMPSTDSKSEIEVGDKNKETDKDPIPTSNFVGNSNATKTMASMKSRSEPVSAVSVDLSSCKEVPMIPDYSAIRLMAKEAISSNNERSSEMKAILKRTMARMMGVELPAQSTFKTSSEDNHEKDIENHSTTLTKETGSTSTVNGLDTLENNNISQTKNMQSLVAENLNSAVAVKTSDSQKEEGETPTKDTNFNQVTPTTPTDNKLFDESLLDNSYEVSVKKPEKSSLTRSNSLQKKKSNNIQQITRSKSFGADEWKAKILSYRTDGAHKSETFNFARADPKDELQKLASLSMVRATREKFGGSLPHKDNLQTRSDHSDKFVLPLKTSQSSRTRDSTEKQNVEFLQAQKKLRKVHLPGKSPGFHPHELTVTQTSSARDSPTKLSQEKEPHSVSKTPVKKQSDLSSQKVPLKVADQAPSSLSFAGIGRVMYQSKAMTWKKSSESVQKKQEIPIRKNVADNSTSIVLSVSSWKEKRTKRKSEVENDYNNVQGNKEGQNITIKSEHKVVKDSTEVDEHVQGGQNSILQRKVDSERIGLESMQMVVKDSVEFDQNVQGAETDIRGPAGHCEKQKVKSQDLEENNQPEVQQAEVKVGSHLIPSQSEGSISTVSEPKEDNRNMSTESTVKAVTAKEDTPKKMEQEPQPHMAIKVDEEAHIRHHKEVRERTKSLLAKLTATSAFNNLVKSMPEFSDDTNLQLRGSEEAAKIRERRRNIKSTPNIDRNWEIFDKESEVQTAVSPETHAQVNQMAPQITDEKNKVNSDKQVRQSPQMRQSPQTQQRVIRKIKRKSFVRRSFGADLGRQSESSTEGLSEDETPRRQQFSSRLDSGFSDMASHSEIDGHSLPHKSHPRKSGGKAKQLSPRGSPSMPPKHGILGESLSSNIVAEVPSDKGSMMLDPAELQRIILQQQEEMQLLRHQMQASQIQASQMQASQMQVTSLSDGSQSQTGNLMNVAAPHVPTMPYMYSHPNMMMVPPRGMMQQPMYYIPQGMQAPRVQMPGVVPMGNYSPYAPSHVPFFLYRGCYRCSLRCLCNLWGCRFKVV